MSFFSWLRNRTSPRSGRWHGSPIRPAARSFRPRLEALEDRALPSTYYAATASDLIADIKAANLLGGQNTIVLTAPTTSHYALTAMDNNTNGPNVLPVITQGDNLTILTGNGSADPGYGDTIDASKAGRLFDVAQGGSLTLENVTLQNGLVRFGAVVGSLVDNPWNSALGSSGARGAAGGAIYNQGTLVLSHAMVQNNSANSSGYESRAAGGAIWSNGSVTVENSTGFMGNSAICVSTGYDCAAGGAICIAGGAANITDSFFGGQKANLVYGAYSGYGGAVYVRGGTVTMSGDNVGLPAGTAGLVGNFVYGLGKGGGLYVAGGTVTLTNDTFIGNYASSSINVGWNRNPAVKLYIDSFTLAHEQGTDPSGVAW